MSKSGATPVVPGARALFAQLASEHSAKVAAEARELAVIHQLCLVHHTVDEDAFNEAAENVVRFGAHGTPAVAEYLSLEVAALLDISDSSAAYRIGRVLNCVYRHPLLWEAVQSGAVEWQRARLVVDEVTSSELSAEAARWVDERITPLLMTLPRNRLRRKLLGLVALADPALARERELKARINRHVTFWAPTIDIGPCSDMTARLDLRDAVALDDTITRLAEILANHGDESTVEIRRATALGILADPEQALDLLHGGVPTPNRRAMTVVLHLSDASLADPESVARIDGRGPLSRETWTEAGHPPRPASTTLDR